MGGTSAHENGGGRPKGEPLVGERMRSKKIITGSGIACVPKAVFPASRS